VPLDSRIVAYLRERIRRADTVLFTGAGFSRGARNLAGGPVPLASELKPLLWNLCYPSIPFDGGSKLEDLYQIAKSRNPRGLVDLLEKHLRVNSDSAPEYYATLFSLPWYSAYTLNVDDLAVAVGRRYSMTRKVVPRSAISWPTDPYRKSQKRNLKSFI